MNDFGSEKKSLLPASMVLEDLYDLHWKVWLNFRAVMRSAESMELHLSQISRCPQFHFRVIVNVICAFKDGLRLDWELLVTFEYGFADLAFLSLIVRLRILATDLWALKDDLICYPYCEVYYSI